MKTNKLLFTITILVFFALFSCKKGELNEPVLINCSLPFADSSVNNPKNLIYQALLDKYVKKGLPGLIVLIRTPSEGLWIGASGYARIEDKTPMKKCNIVYSASIGKTYCAVATMLMVEDGYINLDDKINKYLPDNIIKNLPNGNSATIRNLISQTSGIPNSDYYPAFIADVLNNPYSITTEKLIEYVYGDKPEFEAGTDFNYSSTGYELLARCLDYASGNNHSKYYTSHIFQPLGLNNTFYKNETGFPKPNGLVNCYFDRLGDGKIENVSDVNNYLTQIFTGSDGIMASVYDYYLFLDALVKGQLVNQSSFEEMTNWRETGKDGSMYGFGLQRRKTPYGWKFGHDGDAMGEAADMYYFLGHDVTIVTATNIGTFIETDLTLKYDAFHNDLLDAVFK